MGKRRVTMHVNGRRNYTLCGRSRHGLYSDYTPIGEYEGDRTIIRSCKTCERIFEAKADAKLARYLEDVAS